MQEVYADVTEAKITNQYLIAEGLGVGDLAFAIMETDGVPVTSFPINRIENLGILGRQREVCVATAVQGEMTVDIIYDRFTGCLIGMDLAISGANYATLTITATNMNWGDGEVDPITGFIYWVGYTVISIVDLGLDAFTTGILTILTLILVMIGIILLLRRAHMPPARPYAPLPR